VRPPLGSVSWPPREDGAGSSQEDPKHPVQSSTKPAPREGGTLRLLHMAGAASESKGGVLWVVLCSRSFQSQFSKAVLLTGRCPLLPLSISLRQSRADPKIYGFLCQSFSFPNALASNFPSTAEEIWLRQIRDGPKACAHRLHIVVRGTFLACARRSRAGRPDPKYGEQLTGGSLSVALPTDNLRKRRSCSRDADLRCGPAEWNVPVPRSVEISVSSTEPPQRKSDFEHTPGPPIPLLQPPAIRG